MIDQLGENFQLLLVEGLDGIGTGREIAQKREEKGKEKLITAKQPSLVKCFVKSK